MCGDSQNKDLARYQDEDGNAIVPPELRDLPKMAAEYIIEHGWCQGGYMNEDGAVCIIGAMCRVSATTYDCVIAHSKFLGLGYGEPWNDKDERTMDDVVGVLLNNPITEQDVSTWLAGTS